MSFGDSFPRSVPRIGLGWDRHRLQSGRPCVLGGIPIDSPVGPVGHSDGDVVLHALCDAVLGAAGLADLGTLFPNSDPQWAGADSVRFLQASLQRVEQEGLRVASADIVIVCDRPKLGPHRATIRRRLGDLLALPPDRVNLKGKSTEDVGGAECIEATAVVLLIARH